MKLVFLADAIVSGKVAYSKGQTSDVDNSLGSADRWMRRGIAVEVPEEAVDKKEKIAPAHTQKTSGKYTRKQTLETAPEGEQDKTVLPSETPDVEL